MMRIDLDDDSGELLTWLSSATSITVSDLLDRLVSAYLPALHELREIMAAYPAGTEVHERAANLLQSFGPEPLMSGIKRIAPPDYETLEARFLASLDGSIVAVGQP